MISILENACSDIIFDFNNDFNNNKLIENIIRNNANNLTKLDQLKSDYNEKDFIYPFNYIFDYMQHGLHIIKYMGLKYHINKKLYEVSCRFKIIS